MSISDEVIPGVHLITDQKEVLKKMAKTPYQNMTTRWTSISSLRKLTQPRVLELCVLSPSMRWLAAGSSHFLMTRWHFCYRMTRTLCCCTSFVLVCVLRFEESAHSDNWVWLRIILESACLLRPKQGRRWKALDSSCWMSFKMNDSSFLFLHAGKSALYYGVSSLTQVSKAYRRENYNIQGMHLE